MVMPNFISDCDQLAQLLGTGLINAAIPSLLIVILTWAVLQPKTINARVCGPGHARWYCWRSFR